MINHSFVSIFHEVPLHLTNVHQTDEFKNEFFAVRFLFICRYGYDNFALFHFIRRMIFCALSNRCCVDSFIQMKFTRDMKKCAPLNEKTNGKKILFKIRVILEQSRKEREEKKRKENSVRLTIFRFLVR